MERNYFNIICAVGVVVLVAILAAMMLSENRRVAQVSEENSQIAEKVEKESEERRAAGEEIYASLLEELEESPTGFVCWGDAETVGNREGSLPSSLVQKIDEAYFAKIESDFRYKATLYDIHVPGSGVVNMGASNEGLYEIMTRTGAHQLLVGEAFEMPSGIAEEELVNLTLADPEGNILRFSSQQYAKFGRAVIDDVEGHFYNGTESYDELHVRFAYGRMESGERYYVPAGTEIETEGAEVYRQYTPILFFSESIGDLSGDGEDSSASEGDFYGYGEAYDGEQANGQISAEEFVGCMREVIERYGDGRHGVVICVTEEDSDWDGALREAFGGGYVRCGKSVEDMTREDYDALAEQVLESLETQGLFEDVEEAVERARERLQKM